MKEQAHQHLQSPSRFGDLGAHIMSEISSMHMSQAFKQPVFLQSPDKKAKRQSNFKCREKDEASDNKSSLRISHCNKESQNCDYQQQCVSILENINININITAPQQSYRRRSN